MSQPGRLIVKICGLSSEETVDAAVEAGADMIGFNLFAPSPRYVKVARAAELAARVRGRAEIAILTVDMDMEELREAIDAVRPDWVQLHGNEAAAHADGMRRHAGVKVMKAIGVSAQADLLGVRAYAGAVDRLLLDARPPKNSVLPGGNGVPFDWRLVAGVSFGVPYLLGGGLNPDNVAAALGITGAPGVDVSSGVETAPGRKDAGRIRAFIANARAAAAAELAS
jgi:phosphoribosylanthranilate isomerase